MAKRKKVPNSELLSQAIVKGMQEKKGIDIIVMDLRKVKNAVADFFVICSGGSDKQLEALADSIDEMVGKILAQNPWHVEGKDNKEWMLLDYIDVVAHLFISERRTYYALEKLWGDAEIVEIKD